jgi:Leucine-rich repeat (LRR) protein
MCKSTTTLKILLCFFLVSSLSIVKTEAQSSDRDWWNGLTPAWKKVFQDQELKGKDVDPTDEQLNRIVKVKQIDCSNNKDVESLKPLAKLDLLEIVRCTNCTNIHGLEGLENLVNIKELSCSDNDNINSLMPISGLTNLEKLYCGNTMVKDLKPLANLVKLRVLDVHKSTVSELIFIGTLRNLEKLDVSGNLSLFSLNGMTLELLDCSHTGVESLRPLQNLRAMKEVDVSETNIKGTSLDYLLKSANLEMVRCKNNDITKEDKDTFESIFKKNYPNCTFLISTKVSK